jgi:pyridoxal phosphate enzyme (YggS family)
MSRLAEPRPELRDALAERLGGVRERIRAAALRSGRDPELPRLVVVSKSASPEQVAAAVAAGATHLGENRVRDALPRMEHLASLDLQPVWHLIGHLQRNKVRPALEHFDRIDSVDSLRLALRMDRLAAELGRRMPVLLQVNASMDPAKRGQSPEALPDFAAAVSRLPNLRIEGLMSILLRSDDESGLRRDFGRMRRLQAEMRERFPEQRWERLSMGMTEDYEIAVEEGATELRVGRAVFADLP